MSAEQADEISQLVQKAISDDLPVHAQLESLESAKQINGLRAVFGEVYPDPVRIVAIGPFVEDILSDPADARWRQYSIEFCGGTHLQRTGEAEAFALISEEAVAKGVRRIVALTGKPAEAASAAGFALTHRVAHASELSGDALKAEAGAILHELEATPVPLHVAHRIRAGVEGLQESIKAAAKQAAAAGRDEAVAAARDIAAMAMGAFIVESIPAGGDRQALLAAMDAVRARHESSAIMLLSPDGDSGKISIVASCPQGAINAGLKAGDWVRTAAEACGGKGGGRPDSAQGGGTDVTKLDDAIRAARALATSTLGH